MTKQGLFIGVVTLDIVYLVENFPEKNQKIAASNYTLSAGGPATNAAIAFAYFNNQANLLGVVGHHPVSNLIRADLERYPLTLLDLAAQQSQPPPISSIIVTQSTGDRAVVSINAFNNQVAKASFAGEKSPKFDLVLIDGHQMQVSEVVAQQAKAKGIPVVIDGGSWKPSFEKILPFVDYAICSANFYPPGCQSQEDIFAYLTNYHIPHIAITQGEKPIQYLSNGSSGKIEVSQVKAVDTLGAGDIFHGAFCHYILQENFTQALSQAANIASYSCQFFGTRQWMQQKRE